MKTLEKLMKLAAVLAFFFGLVKGIFHLLEVLNQPAVRRYIPIFEEAGGEGFLDMDEV